MARFEGALNFKEQEELRLAYFTKWEIDQFNRATTVDGKLQRLNTRSDNWKAMLHNRIRLVEKLKSLKWSREKVLKLINSYYENRRSKRSPFDLLQVEASPSAKQIKLSDTEIARKLLKQARIRATFGQNYTHGLQQVMVPRNIPPAPAI